MATWYHRNMATRRFSVVLEPDVNGGFTVLVPSLPGVVTQGETIEEALANARDAIALTIADEYAVRLPTGQAQLFEIDVAIDEPS